MNIRRKTLLLGTLFVIALLLMGCKEKEHENEYVTHREPMQRAQEKEDEEIKQTEYVIQSVDMVTETITAFSMDSWRPVRYSYNLGTKFLDKYGQRCSVTNFVPGEVVILGERDEKSILSSVQLSDGVWRYTDIVNYEIHNNQGIFEIAGSNYRITDNTVAYSNDEAIALDVIGEDDVLQVIGKDRDIISVVVTTGHGYIQLRNSTLFLDSMICVGDRIFTTITGDMLIEVPEGTYDITVANNGYGGTGSYTVTRNETTEVDLDQLKGDGPKVCKLKFETDIEGVEVYVDGQKMAVNKKHKVTYGAHRLTVLAEGYDKWEKTLVVNSPSATIALDLEETETKSDGSTSANNTNSSNSSNTSNNNTGSSSNNNSTTTNNDNNSTSNTTTNKNVDTEVDYLTTISNMLNKLLD